MPSQVQSTKIWGDSKQPVEMTSGSPGIECDSISEAGVFTEVVVVRHGETTWNASRIIQGHLNSELNEVGKDQAILVANRLSKGPKFTAVYASDLKRACETAQIIVDRCNLPEAMIDPNLRERHLGDLQGLVLRDARKLKPEAYKAFCSSNLDQELPGGGESVNQLHQRCTSCVERIARKHIGERILIVTHGGVLRELYKHAASRGPVEVKVMNTSVNVFHISENKWIIKTWGDVSHLRESGFPKDSFGGDKNSG